MTLALPEPRKTAGGIVGQIVFIDRFGNLVTNPKSAVVEAPGPADALDFTCGDVQIHRLRRTCADAPPAEFLALIGGFGYLKVAILGEMRAKTPLWRLVPK